MIRILMIGTKYYVKKCSSLLKQSLCANSHKSKCFIMPTHTHTQLLQEHCKPLVYSECFTTKPTVIGSAMHLVGINLV